ncbi:preprotein translocase subunit SecE [Buchnera aphidicola]|uniref:preprotein translocase subunit SecE n=1 Tax=Buchnera aphidicola TaxID=9 RepID=UPI00094C422E
MHIYTTYMNHIKQIKWFCIITICLSITLIHFFFIKELSILKKIIFFCLFGTILLNIFFRTNIGKNTLSYIKSIKSELSNIIWPNYIETTKTTGIVLFLIILTTIFLWILDGIILHIISQILISRL